MRSQATALLLTITCTAAASTSAEERSYSPYAGRSFPERLLWGDTHLHTNMSPDAGSSGNREIDPASAFRFARGETVTAHNGMALRLSRPLDFLVVADHGEYLGLLPDLRAGEPGLRQSDTGRRWMAVVQEKGRPDVAMGTELGRGLMDSVDLVNQPDWRRSVWQRVVATADRFDEPGRFSAFAGYEWSAMPGGDNLHRVVVFADDSSRTGQTLPFTAFDSTDPEALWRYLAEYEQLTGGQAIAIPHNSNLSGGLMFKPKTAAGEPIDRDYATRRSRWEPIVEATQYKGDSETHPLNSPQDEFAGYEIWDKTNITGAVAQTPEMQPYQYMRSALRIGLQQEALLGVNPFRFGLIGSTDAHTGFASAEEGNFWGKMSAAEPAPGRWNRTLFPNPRFPEFTIHESDMAASGYVGVWAEENTRAAIFAAMKRREVYASTGPRITLRFFGGADFQPEDAVRADLAAAGYAGGVPMGAELPPLPAGRAPRFLLAAARDPLGAHLDRLQIVKGWLDSKGETHERVYDVAWSGGRRPGPDGKLPPVGNTVDEATASWRNSIGAAELATVWTDPDFDPAERAFWYVRVIEIPTPRWSTYDQAFFGETLPASIPRSTQERAYSSPIWYRPPEA